MGKRLKRHSGMSAGVAGKITMLDEGGTCDVAGNSEKQRIDELFATFFTMYKIGSNQRRPKIHVTFSYKETGYNTIKEQ